MIERFLFELVPSSVPDINIFDISTVFVISLFWSTFVLFISYFLLFCIFKMCEIGKTNDDFRENFLGVVLILSLSLIFTPPLLLMSNVDFFNARYMAEYANGNYKYSKTMKHCITQNKENYRDKDGNLIDHNTVRGIMLCYQWERDDLKNQQIKEQIKKEVR